MLFYRAGQTEGLDRYDRRKPMGAKKLGKKGVSGKQQHNAKGSFNNHQLKQRGERPGYIGAPRGNGQGQSYEHQQR